MGSLPLPLSLPRIALIGWIAIGLCACGPGSTPPLGALNFTFEARSPDEQVGLLDGLGYRGIAMFWPGMDQFAAFERAAAERSKRVPINAVLHTVTTTEPLDVSGLETVLGSMSGEGVALWLMVGGSAGVPSEIAPRIQEVADRTAAAGVELVLYPHQGTAIESAEQALAVLDAAQRPDAMLSIHLCHELKAGNGERLGEVIAKTVHRAALVTLNGANRDVSAEGWQDAIQQLGRGDLDVQQAFLEPLLAHSYSRPILLHTYGVSGAPETHLRQSMEAWRQMAKGP